MLKPCSTGGLRLARRACSKFASVPSARPGARELWDGCARTLTLNRLLQA